MKTISKVGFAAMAALFFAACGSARLVDQTQAGGTFALDGDRGKAMEDANNQMAAHCGPGNYQVVRQGDVVVGEDTYHNEDTAYGEDTAQSRNGRRSSTSGGSSTSATTSTRAATEWRVTYVCGGAMAPAPVGQPAAPPQGDPGAPGY